MSQGRINSVEVQDIQAKLVRWNGQKQIHKMPEEEKYLRKIILTKTFEIPVGSLSVFWNHSKLEVESCCKGTGRVEEQ